MSNQPSAAARLLASKKSWLIGYVVMVTVIVVGFYQFRSWSQTVYANEQGQIEWQKWRSDVEAQPAEAPVKRRVPKSQQPPATVLLTDYFATCLVIAIVLSTALYFAFMFVTRGAILSPGVINSQPE